MLPVIAPGCAGTLRTVTVIGEGELAPHELFAVTDTVPPVDPTVVVIEFVEDDPVQPEGSVHV